MKRREFLASSVGLALSGAAASLDGNPAAAAGLRQDETKNAKIQRARETALDLLKPSRKDLDRGLGLHRDAIVFDAYGFAPGAALDGDAFRKEVEEGASEAELNDLLAEITVPRREHRRREFGGGHGRGGPPRRGDSRGPRRPPPRNDRGSAPRRDDARSQAPTARAPAPAPRAEPPAAAADTVPGDRPDQAPRRRRRRGRRGGTGPGAPGPGAPDGAGAT